MSLITKFLVPTVKRARLLSTTFYLLGFMGVLPALAVRFPDGRVAFDRPPKLLDVNTPYPDVSVTDTTYFFTVQVPANAGEPLQRIVLTQQPAQETILFLPEATQAYVGSRRNRLGLGEVNFDSQAQTLSVNFNPPVPPGTRLTLAVSPERNPFYDGVYLFGVTAFPVGEKSQGQYIGTGRLQFYRGGNGGLN